MKTMKTTTLTKTSTPEEFLDKINELEIEITELSKLESIVESIEGRIKRELKEQEKEFKGQIALLKYRQKFKYGDIIKLIPGREDRPNYILEGKVVNVEIILNHVNENIVIKEYLLVDTGAKLVQINAENCELLQHDTEGKTLDRDYSGL